MEKLILILASVCLCLFFISIILLLLLSLYRRMLRSKDKMILEIYNELQNERINNSSARLDKFCKAVHDFKPE